MACTDDEKAGCLSIMVILFIVMIILASLYTDPNLPNLSIEEFSVPAFNKTSDQISGDLYFDLKLRNMNKAIGLYYDDPFTLAFSYYPIQEPYQKYVWEYTVPAFYQGNGKTKHIRTLVGNHLPTVVNEEEEDSRQEEAVESYLQLPSNSRVNLRRAQIRNWSNSTVVDEEDKELSSPAAVAAQVVSFRVDLILSYRFKLWVDNDRRVLEVGGEVVVDANSGERVSKGSVKLVESAAAAVAAGGLVLVVVVFTSFLLMSI